MISKKFIEIPIRQPAVSILISSYCLINTNHEKKQLIISEEYYQKGYSSTHFCGKYSSTQFLRNDYEQ